MVKDFEIMRVFNHHNRGQFIFARHLGDNHNFKVKEGSMLEGIAIYHYVDIPAIDDENNEQRLDVFVFRPLDLFPGDRFKEGQLVKLVIPS
jgi:hypothetical protein